MVLDKAMSWCQKNKLMCVGLVLLVLYFTGHLQPLVDSLMQFLGMSGYANSDLASGEVSGSPIKAAEESGNEAQMAVKGYPRTPSTCYPQQTLKPEDLLPADEAKAANEFASTALTAEGIMHGNLLKAGEHIGVDTVGQSLRNANRQLRSEPPNPQVNVSPWMNTNIGPDLMRRPLESPSCGSDQ